MFCFLGGPGGMWDLSCLPRNQMGIFCIDRQILYQGATREVPKTADFIPQGSDVPGPLGFRERKRMRAQRREK